MSGNGTDLGHITAMLQRIIESQNVVERRLDEQGGRIDALTREVRETKIDVSGLRQALADYHGAVIGHGVLISDLDERVHRIEGHLDLPPPRRAS